MRKLALFDLDHTILSIDSDHAWGEFLVAHHFVDAAAHRAKNDQFYQDYLDGCLDAVAYNQFVFEFLQANDWIRLAQLHQWFMTTVVKPAIRPKALAAIQHHLSQGDTVAVITATNRFITAPIVAACGINPDSHLMATEPQKRGFCYTGKLQGVPCVGVNKLIHLQAWLDKQQPFEHISAYSDSFNDIPLLSKADSAYAVCPDKRLASYAQQMRWPVLRW